MFFIVVAMTFLRRETPPSYAMKPAWISHIRTTVKK